MTTVLLDAIYLLGLAITSPVWLYRMLRHGRYRKGLGQRLGFSPIRYGLQPTIMVCGVSLGEIRAAEPLVKELHSQLPDYRVVVASWTDTGLTEAKRLFEPDHIAFARPVDLSLAVGRMLDRVRPDLVVLIEGDVWPNFLAACNKRSIPAVMVNGRMSPTKGYPRYRMLGPLASMLFNRLAAIGVQDEAYAQRFRSLGVEAGKVHVTGMMKFDRPLGQTVPAQETLAAALGVAAGQELIVAGGTGEGEERMVLEAFARVAKERPAARIAIVPRKPERFDEVARLIESMGHKIVRRSQCPDGTVAQAEGTAVILGDTMGELRKFYALASCIFVGRSLVPMGGSDMIEAAALGKPTCYGPHTFNFPQAVDLAQNGCVRIADQDALAATLLAWLGDPQAAACQAAKAQEFIRRQQGATRKNVDMICEVLGRTPATATGGIATDRLEQKA